MLTAIWGKLQAYLAIIGIVLMAIATAYAKGRKGGGAAAHREAQKATDKITKKFQEVDAQKPDFGKAIKDLRKRSLDP